jgi:hypothetical protein
MGKKMFLILSIKQVKAGLLELRKGIETFLKDHNLRLIEHNYSEKLENKYFKDEYGNIVEKINGTHCIAYAKK